VFGKETSVDWTIISDAKGEWSGLKSISISTNAPPP